MFNHSDAYRRSARLAFPEDLTRALAGARILVTGATGLIGAMLVDALLSRPEAGVSVCAGARNPEKARARFPEHLDNPRFFILPFDLTKPFTPDASFDYILHTASPAHPLAYSAQPVQTLLGCVEGVKSLLDFGRQTGLKRFLYVSSGEVYGQPPESSDGLSETDFGAVDGLSARACYPVGKRAAETLCACYRAEYGTDFVVARPSHTYGPTQTDEDSRASAQFLRKGASGEPIVLKSAGGQLRSYLYASDCASGILTTLVRGESGQAYNVANPDAVVTVAELAREIARVAGTDVRFENPDAVEAAGYTPNRSAVLKADKLIALGWHPRYTVPLGVAEALEILRVPV